MAVNFDPDLMKNIMGSPARKVVVPQKKAAPRPTPAPPTPGREPAKKWRSITVRLSAESADWMRDKIDASRGMPIRVTFGDIMSGALRTYLKAIADGRAQAPAAAISPGPGRPSHYGSSEVPIHLGYSDELAEGLHQLSKMMGTRSYSAAARAAIDYARGTDPNHQSQHRNTAL